MKRKARWMFLLVLMMVLLPLSISASSSWSTFGKDQERTREAVGQSTQPPLYLKWQTPNIGWSISQPIVANEHIFHQAGGYLYKIPLDIPFTGGNLSVESLLNNGTKRVKISNDYHATSHPVYDAETNSIYVGTGDNRIRKVNPKTLEITKSINAYARLVSAPTTVGNELIAYGTGEAHLYLNKNNETTLLDLGSNSSMEITGTFGVKGGENPIIFVPVSYKYTNRSAFVDAYRIIDNGPGNEPSYEFVWSQPFQTDNGVSASVTYDEAEDHLYFADKSGTVYAVDASTGKQVWKNTTYASSSTGTTLVNNSPALSGDTLVVPYRYQNGRETGMIAAIDTDSGNVKWTRTSSGDKRSSGNFDGEIANAPTISTDGDGNSIVLIGTTEGNLRIFDLNSGEPHYITEENGRQQYALDALSGSGSSYYQGAGLATEILVADGHIVFGANTSAQPNASGTNGTLYAYSTPWTEDFGDLTGRLRVQDKIQQGLPLRVFSATVLDGLESIETPFSTRLYVDGVMVDEQRFEDGFAAEDTRGGWTTVPPEIATDEVGTFPVRLVVDYYDEVDDDIDMVKENNIIRDTYEVVPPEPPECGGDSEWNGDECVREWTEHHVGEKPTRAILIPNEQEADGWGGNSAW
ncbi:outer membrane protein assembly factor BamB family protein [Lentibacillus salinarum]|uniref:PQQ-binding-like beta-propeller repeat protein n=1 Tax=Lentibacillus salinarum TaxID=446820 RepID=A0ABW3ZXF9_9BACI